MPTGTLAIDRFRVRSRQAWLAKSGTHLVVKDFYRVNVREIASLIVELARELASD